MRGNVSEDNTDLALHRSFFDNSDRRSAHASLMHDVFGIEARLSHPADAVWTPFSLFDPGGRCIASVEAAAFDLAMDGSRLTATGLRRVAVAPDRRGQGLLRRAMEAALAWCATRSNGPTLLYTETPDLYARFGFSSVPQHAFRGPPPAPAAGASPARRLDLCRPDDLARVRACVRSRTPVSGRIAAMTSVSLFLENATAFDLAVLADVDAVVAYEVADDDLRIVDIAARTMPSLAHVLGALGRTPPRVVTLFPPDRLGWSGEPTPEDAGLMARGPLPAAMSRPFMLAPTAEF